MSRRTRGCVEHKVPYVLCERCREEAYRRTLAGQASDLHRQLEELARCVFDAFPWTRRTRRKVG